MDPATARCGTCHEELLKRAVIHEPARENCRTCHSFQKKDGQTTVELASSGTRLCVGCHSALSAAAEGKLPATHMPVSDSCLNCHDPHGSKERRLLKAPDRELCASCHSPVDMTAPHRIGVAGASCLGCHAPHGSAVKGMLVGTVQHAPFAERSCEACHRKGLGARTRLASSGAALCYACHSDLEAKYTKGSVHTAVARGQCTGCHAPHVTSVKKLLKADGGALCFPCHPAVREKVMSKGAHAAAREGCTDCHYPHNGEQPRQLTAPVPDLCLGCHDSADTSLRKKHLDADLGKVACVGCHDPHGSKEPRLLATGSVHPPFREGCDTCHLGNAKKLVENGGRALCVACHADVGERVEKAKIPHAAATSGECTDCHSPHASLRSRLLKATSAEICGGCHADQTAGAGEKAHGAIDMIGCQACHLPHGGDTPKLLRTADRAALCLACHDVKTTRTEGKAKTVRVLDFELPAERVRSVAALSLSAGNTKDHPVTGHRVVGKPTREELERAQVTFSGELTCLTCHDPHKSRAPKLARIGPSGSPVACETCHAK